MHHQTGALTHYRTDHASYRPFTRPTRTTQNCLVLCVGGVNRIGDKTRQFCLVSTQFPISKFSVVLNRPIFETEQLQIGNWVDKTKLSCLVAKSVHTADTDNDIKSYVITSTDSHHAAVANILREIIMVRDHFLTLPQWFTRDDIDDIIFSICVL